MSRLTPGLGSYAFRWSIGHGDRVPPRPMTAMEVLEFGIAHRAGVVQFADNMRVHDLDDAALDALAARGRGAGVALEVGMQGFDPALLDRYLEIARRLEAGIVRVALDAGDLGDEAGLADAFRRAGDAAAGAGARVAIENHFGFASRRLVALLEAVDHDAVGVCLDVGNSICGGEWPAETVRLLAPRAINLHLKDWDILPDPYGVGFRVQGTPFGEGRTDTAAVLAALADRPPMSVVYEHWLPWPGDHAAARAAEEAWTAHGLAAFVARLGPDAARGPAEVVRS